MDMMSPNGHLSYRTRILQERAGGEEIMAACEEMRDLPCRIETDPAGSSLRVIYREEREGIPSENILEIAEDGEIRILRSDPTYSSQYRFRSGEETSFLLSTPYGEIPLTAMTDELAAEKTPRRVDIRIRYRIADVAGEAHEFFYEILSDGDLTG